MGVVGVVGVEFCGSTFCGWRDWPGGCVFCLLYLLTTLPHISSSIRPASWRDARGMSVRKYTFVSGVFMGACT